jgi:hypothetical protein
MEVIENRVEGGDEALLLLLGDLYAGKPAYVINIFSCNHRYPTPILLSGR